MPENLILSHRTLSFVVLLFVGLVALAGWIYQLCLLSRPADKIANVATVPLADVLAAVKRELEAAQPHLSSEDLPLASVKLLLQVVVLEASSGTGKVMLLPLGASSKIASSEETSRTQTVTVVLAPPSVSTVKGTIDLKNLGLASAIRAVHEDLRSGMRQPPQLEPRKIEIALAFGVARRNAATSGLELKAFSGEIEAKADKEATQKIELVFEQPKAASQDSDEPPGW